MSGQIYNVLFLCTHNSARSILAESLLNHLGRGRFRAHSAGSSPAGRVHPLALEILHAMDLPADAARSKHWDELATPAAPRMDFVFTVCAKAAGETCPVWPGTPVTAHWGVEDPAAFEGTHDEKRRRFHNAASVLRRRIELFLSLPLDKLDAMTVQRKVEAIGKS